MLQFRCLLHLMDEETEARQGMCIRSCSFWVSLVAGGTLRTDPMESPVCIRVWRKHRSQRSSGLGSSTLIFASTSSLSRFSAWFQDHILCVDFRVSILKFLQMSEVKSRFSFFLFCCCCCCSFFFFFLRSTVMVILKLPLVDIHKELNFSNYRTMVAWTNLQFTKRQVFSVKPLSN